MRILKTPTTAWSTWWWQAKWRNFWRKVCCRNDSTSVARSRRRSKSRGRCPSTCTLIWNFWNAYTSFQQCSSKFPIWLVYFLCLILFSIVSDNTSENIRALARLSSLSGSHFAPEPLKSPFSWYFCILSTYLTVLNIFLHATNYSILAHEFDARRRMISKTFYQQLRSRERQSLVGPPESMREHVVAAAKAMRNGNWSACNNYIINEKMNAKVSFFLQI